MELKERVIPIINLKSLFVGGLATVISTTVLLPQFVGAEETTQSLTVTVTNNETGEVNSYTPDSSQVKTSVDPNTEVEEYEVVVPLGPSAVTNAAALYKAPKGYQGISKDTSTTDSGVKARLAVDYDTYITSKVQKVKLNRVYGSWGTTSSLYSLSKRSVDAHTGAFLGKKMATKYPTTNSFSYTLDWPYNEYGGGNALPRAESNVTSKVEGMTATYSVRLVLTFP